MIALLMLIDNGSNYISSEPGRHMQNTPSVFIPSDEFVVYETVGMFPIFTLDDTEQTFLPSFSIRLISSDCRSA
jgi:hypothetical protein